MSPQIRNEIYATLAGLGVLLLGLWLQAPVVFLVVLALGAYAGTKLLLPPVPPTTSGESPKYSSAKSTPPIQDRPALPVDTNNFAQQVEAIASRITREIPRTKEIKVTRKLKRILELSREATVKLVSAGAYTHLRSIVKLLSALEILLRKYLTLSSRTVVDSKLTRTRRDFQLLLYKIEDALETYTQEGGQAEIQNLSVDLRVVEEDIDALQG